MKMAGVKRRVYEILETAERGDKVSRTFDIFILILIVLNVIAVVLGTVPHIDKTCASFLYYFELFSIVIFSVEYLLRVWSITSSPRFRSPLTGRLRFIATPQALIDLLAILPFFLPFTGALDLRSLRALRLFRLIRVLKVGRYSDSIRLLGAVLRNKREELLVTLVMILILMVITSSLMYFAENEAQPEVFSSIPASMWWSVATLTTVGYGDDCPVTPIGKILGACVAILGIGMFALPTGILGAGFLEEVQRAKGKQKCPHCGREI